MAAAASRPRPAGRSGGGSAAAAIPCRGHCLGCRLARDLAGVHRATGGERCWACVPGSVARGRPPPSPAGSVCWVAFSVLGCVKTCSGGTPTALLQSRKYGEIALHSTGLPVSCALNVRPCCRTPRSVPARPAASARQRLPCLVQARRLGPSPHGAPPRLTQDTTWEAGSLRRVGVKQSASVLRQLGLCAAGKRPGRLYLTDGSMPDYYAQRYPVDAPGEGRGGTADGACQRASVLPGRGALHARKVFSAWKAHSSAGLLMVWQGGQARGTCRLPSCCDSRRVAPPPLLQACRATWTAEPTQCCPPPCAPAAQPTSSMPSRWAAAGGRRMRLRGRRPMLGFSFVCVRGSWAGAIQRPPPEEALASPRHLHPGCRRRRRTRAPARRPSRCLGPPAAAPTSPPSTLRPRRGPPPASPLPLAGGAACTAVHQMQ